MSNEAGTYNFASLPPGVHTVSARLPGFQTATFTDVQLGNRDQIRLNFTVEDRFSDHERRSERRCRHASGDGQPFGWPGPSRQKVHDMPLVGNNVRICFDYCRAPA